MITTSAAGGKKLSRFKGYEDYPCSYGFFDRHLGSGAEGSTITARDCIKDRPEVCSLASAHQVHGARVYTVDSALEEDFEVAGYDALITNFSGLGLTIQHADCQAVLLFDPITPAIGAVHSGWRGSVANILGNTVEAMSQVYSSRASDLQAVISPSLGPCCAEFIHHRQELPEDFRRYMVSENYFDFWRISRRQLQDCGLSAESIQLPTICTSCSEEYFSYRRACRTGDGKTGRNYSVIVLHS